MAAGILVFLGFFFPIGFLLFLGEWLFGSIGWGVLLFTELGVAVALTAVVVALGVPGSQDRPGRRRGRSSWRSSSGSSSRLALTNEGWTRLGDSVLPGVEEGFRPLGTAMAFSAAVVGDPRAAPRGAGRTASAARSAGSSPGAIARRPHRRAQRHPVRARAGRRARHRGRRHRLDRPRRACADAGRRRRRQAQGPVLAEPDHRHHEGDDRVGARHGRRSGRGRSEPGNARGGSRPPRGLGAGRGRHPGQDPPGPGQDGRASRRAPSSWPPADPSG